MTLMGTIQAHGIVYTRMSVVRSVLMIKKTSTFSNKDLRKTLSQYVIARNPAAQMYKDFPIRTTLIRQFERQRSGEIL